jgi:hypothetical protein
MGNAFTHVKPIKLHRRNKGQAAGVRLRGSEDEPGKLNRSALRGESMLLLITARCVDVVQNHVSGPAIGSETDRGGNTRSREVARTMLRSNSTAAQRQSLSNQPLVAPLKRSPVPTPACTVHCKHEVESKEHTIRPRACPHRNREVVHENS